MFEYQSISLSTGHDSDSTHRLGPLSIRFSAKSMVPFEPPPGLSLGPKKVISPKVVAKLATGLQKKVAFKGCRHCRKTGFFEICDHDRLRDPDRSADFSGESTPLQKRVYMFQPIKVMNLKRHYMYISSQSLDTAGVATLEQFHFVRRGHVSLYHG